MRLGPRGRRYADPMTRPQVDDRGGEDVGELLRRASHQLRHRWVEILQPLELSPHHARALRAIDSGEVDSGEALRLSELADRLRVANRSVTDVVDALVERGLVERGPVPGDRRAIAVRTTEAGRELLGQVEQARTADVEDFLGRLAQSERRELAALLHKLTD